ncbi:hypothetical protein HPG69_003816 [Diceros bicornis minor]|uniref:Centrosomal protein of 76 kDa C-terminal domain-containing protein n=1 Tax=Diceros bicornis minor TaxID=77932 RepID=A0A7J7EUQ7_DICBM|nr:hypothetical protein HPG69_003816 [Diceros bicornis minor]
MMNPNGKALSEEAVKSVCAPGAVIFLPPFLPLCASMIDASLITFAFYEYQRATSISAGNEEFQDAMRRLYLMLAHLKDSQYLFHIGMQEIICCHGDQVRLAAPVLVFTYPESTRAARITLACKHPGRRGAGPAAPLRHYVRARGGAWSVITSPGAGRGQQTPSRC